MIGVNIPEITAIDDMQDRENVAPADSQKAKLTPKAAKKRNNGENGDLLPLVPLKPISSSNPKIDKEQAIKLRKRGLTHQEIANYFNCAQRTVTECLHRHMPNDINLQEFKDSRADKLAYTGARLLYSLSDEDIKKMSGLQKITGMGIVFDKECIEKGKPNVITANFHFTPEVEKAITAQVAKETQEAIAKAHAEEALDDDEDY